MNTRKVVKPKIIHCAECRYWINNLQDPNLRRGYCDRPEAGIYCCRTAKDYCSKAEKVERS